MFLCSGYTDDCLETVPLDDLELLVEVYGEGDEVHASTVKDDWKFHVKPHRCHIRYVRYCSKCIEVLAPDVIQNDLDEIARYELKRLRDCPDDEL